MFRDTEQLLLEIDELFLHLAERLLDGA